MLLCTSAFSPVRQVSSSDRTGLLPGPQTLRSELTVPTLTQDHPTRPSGPRAVPRAAPVTPKSFLLSGPFNFYFCFKMLLRHQPLTPQIHRSSVRGRRAPAGSLWQPRALYIVSYAGFISVVTFPPD